MTTTNMNNHFETKIKSPWYRHFWAWFFLGILFISLASTVTIVFFSLEHPDVEIKRAPLMASSQQLDHKSETAIA